MFSVGQRLRAARIDQGLDLDAVVARTKINEKFLQAIESDDRESFPSGFFYKSFVDQYARALSVDTREIDAQIQAMLTAEAPLPLPGEGGRPIRREQPIEIRSRGARGRTYASVATLVLVLVGCSGFYAWWRNLNAKPAAPAISTEPARTAVKTNPANVPAIASDGQNQPQIPAAHQERKTVAASFTAAAAQVSAAGAQPARLLVELIARQKTWLSISSDGLLVFKGTLDANESKTVEGKEFAKLRVNDASALDVKLNGKAIGPLGAPGQFRIVVFTRDKFHVLESAKDSD